MLRLARELWTDGSVHPNPGYGGWAVVDHNGDLRKSGSAEHTTNIAMEGMAILNAIDLLGHDGGFIRTDSEFWVKALTQWCPRWEREGWMQPINNVPLARVMWETYNLYPDVCVEWVRGHNGDPNNEAADRHANNARRQGWEAAQRALSVARASHPSRPHKVKED